MKIFSDPIKICAFGALWVLMASTGLGTISLGGLGTGNIRIWMVAITLLFVIRLLHVFSFTGNEIRVMYTTLYCFGYVIVSLLSGLNAIDSSLFLQRFILIVALSMLFIVLSKIKSTPVFYMCFDVVIFFGVLFAVSGLMDIYFSLFHSDLFKLIHQFDAGGQFSVNGAFELGSYELVLRARGFYTEPNEFSQFLILPFGYCLALAFFPYKQQNNIWPIFGVIILIMAQISTHSRGGFVGYLVEFFGVLIVSKIYNTKRSLISINKMLIIVAIIFIVILFIFITGEVGVSAIINTFVGRLITTGTNDDWTIGIRLSNIYIAIDQIFTSYSYFFVGVGVGNLSVSMVKEATTTNQFLDVFVETGIMGFLFYAMIIVSTLNLAHRFMRKSGHSFDPRIFTVFVGSYVTFLGHIVGGMTYPTHMLFIFWLNVGLLVAISSLKTRHFIPIC